MRDPLGGKGAGLAEMTSTGLPVPPGFTVSTDVCALFESGGGKVPQAVDRVASEVMKAAGVKVRYLTGTMIELPRGAIVAADLAKYSDFFSFGTNDLTQMTFGFSRDDSAKFLRAYRDQRILDRDPFASIDIDGVGRLVEMGATEGRRTRPSLKLGVCGEHGGDPASIQFFARVGLDYVSASPYRVPTARLAAAHAALRPSDDAAR